GAKRFFPKRGQHRVEHHAADLVAVVGIVQGKGENIACSLDYQSGYGGIGQVRSFSGNTSPTVCKKAKPCQQPLQRTQAENPTGAENNESESAEKMHYSM